MERLRRPQGTGTLYRRGPYWAAQIGLTRPDGKRSRRCFSGATFCKVLRSLSEAVPPRPDEPMRNPNRVEAMRQARQLGTHTAQEWYAKVRAAKGVCYYCHEHVWRLVKEHRTPVTRGGSDAIDNLVPACATCNHEKNILTEQEYLCWRTAMGKPFGSSIEDAEAWLGVRRA